MNNGLSGEPSPENDDHGMITDTENGNQNLDNENTPRIENLEHPEDVEYESNRNIRERFDAHYQKVINQKPEEREFLTRIDRKINENVMSKVNTILEEYIADLMGKDELNAWTLNSLTYTAALTVLESEGKLAPVKRRTKKRTKPGWQSVFEDQINGIRRKLSYIDIMLKMKPENRNKQQKKVGNTLRRLYGNLKTQTLEMNQVRLKHELKVVTEKLRRRKTVYERMAINKKFKQNPKAIYRKFRKETSINVTDAPSKEDIEKFWYGIWGVEKTIDIDAEWYKDMSANYCKDVTTKEYIIDEQRVCRVINRMPNNKSPGIDQITHFWWKKLESCLRPLTTIYGNIFNNIVEMPDWLPIARTTLIAKNMQTNLAKNYRPIACENNMFKIYSGILASFVNEHCDMNDIIYPEQAANKPGSWGCIDQLLINKSITEEVKKYRRNAAYVWLDYKKAYDSVSHEWIEGALRLAKVPEKVVNAIKHIMKLWKTKMFLDKGDETISTHDIQYRRGILQGDILSVVIFILCLNPLSYLLRKQEGYKMGLPGKRDMNITHLMFVDDLKLYGNNMDNIKSLLKTVIEFSKNIGMSFGEEKCSYIFVEGGKRKSLGQNIKMNDTNIGELEEEQTYKYLGLDETTIFASSLNKDKLTKEYTRRIRKIWSSHLNAYNKVIATNTFAVPVLTYSFGLIDWTKAELKNIDIKTRKVIAMNNSICRRGDVDRIYVDRKKGGRGLKNLEDEFLCRIYGIKKHIDEEQNRNPFLKKAMGMNNNITRIAEELSREIDIEQESSDTPDTRSERTKTKILEIRENAWKDKQLHGYFIRETKKIDQLDEKRTWSWLQSNHLSSEMEGYILTLQDQEIYTKSRQKKNEKDPEKEVKIDSSCRLCHKKEEDIQHILDGCSAISSNMYINDRHDPVATVVYKEMLKLYNIERNPKEPITTVTIGEKADIWWDMKIKTPRGVKHTKPDIVVWDKQKKICQIIDISVPLDVNVNRKYQEKIDSYIPLAAELQRLYTDYRFEVTPIIIGSLGVITKMLERNLLKLGIPKERLTRTVNDIQKRALIGSMKIVRAFMRMKEE